MKSHIGNYHGVGGLVEELSNGMSMDYEEELVEVVVVVDMVDSSNGLKESSEMEVVGKFGEVMSSQNCMYRCMYKGVFGKDQDWVVGIVEEEGLEECCEGMCMNLKSHNCPFLFSFSFFK